MGGSLAKKLQEPNCFLVAHGCGIYSQCEVDLVSQCGGTGEWRSTPRYYMSDRDADRSCLHKIKTTTEQSPLMMDKVNFNLCVAYNESLSTLSVVYPKRYRKSMSAPKYVFKMIICSNPINA
jgi:hypothetical protein